MAFRREQAGTARGARETKMVNKIVFVTEQVKVGHQRPVPKGPPGLPARRIPSAISAVLVAPAENI